jgi:hypothetical protein
MQFKVPQFLEIEDKIFGPFTFREFVYLAGGAGICFVFYKLLGLFWGILPILGVAGFSLALVYYKPNNKPFLNMLEAGAKYLTQNKLYIWKKGGSTSKKDQIERVSSERKTAVPNYYEAKLTGSKLRDLAWSLDVLDLNKHQNN